MKNNSRLLPLTIVAASAALLLGTTACKDSKTETGAAVVTASEKPATGDNLNVAYINIDSLLTNYQYSKDLQDEFMRKAESKQATINQQGKSLENDMAEFKRKVENNAFFDQDRARREQERIIKRQQEFQALSQRLSAEMQEDQLKMNTALSDTIRSQIKLYNETIGHYKMIFSNTMGDNLLYADEVYNITKEVTDFLNSRYKKSSDTGSTPAPSEKK